MSSALLLNGILTKEKAKYPSGLADDRLFEFYCADNLLVNFDIDTDEIEAGIVDGANDAGVDAVYTFINGLPLTDDFEFDRIAQPVEIQFFVLQSKNQDTFKEGPVDKLASSLPLLLDYKRSQTDLEKVFNKEVVTRCRDFLSSVEKLADRFPKISIRICYCCKGNEPSSAAKAKAGALEETLEGLSFSDVLFAFFGAQELYDRSSVQKRLVKGLATTGTPLSGTNSFVALCKLKDYARFISDTHQNLIPRMFEANVRAYQGEVEVNREIAESLTNPIGDLDFWWLNNGVTIVADEASYISNNLQIANPLIVNGLQTSHVIHDFAKKAPDSDERSILIRVIQEKDPSKRDQIIRATNRQTSIKNSSFRATEPVHREIEDYLVTLGYFYDRRKNLHKREGRPVGKIISIDRLAQAVMSVLLKEPHTARARPTTAIKSEANYKRIFSGDKTVHPLAMYGIVVQLLEAVDRAFRAMIGKTERLYLNNLRFHVLMVLSWAVNGGQTIVALGIPGLNVNAATDAQVQAVADWVFAEFKACGGDDRAAKEGQFTDHLKSSWTVSSTKI